MATNINSEANNFVTGLSGPKMIAVDEGGDLVFVDNGSESIMGTIDISDGSVRRQPGLTKDRLGNLSSIFVWSNNAALYSIDTKSSAIIKQLSVAGNYQIPGDGSIWRQDELFSSGIDIAVEGSVYVLVEGRGIRRVFGGNKGRFTLNGLLPADE